MTDRERIQLPAASSLTKKHSPFHVDYAGVLGPIIEVECVPIASFYSLNKEERFDRIPEKVFRLACDYFLGSIDGMTFAQHCCEVSLFTGLPLQVIQRASVRLSERLARGGCPPGFSPRKTADWVEVVQVARGSRLLVVAAGNHPGAHSLWPEALAFGYAVFVKPSSRDPLTPYRLIRSLMAAGVPSNQLHYIPIDHASISKVRHHFDSVLAYGDTQSVTAVCTTPGDIPQGPGHSAVWTDDVYEQDAVATVAESVIGDGGVGCINASSWFAPNVGEAIGALQDELATCAPRSPFDPDARLPTVTLQQAQRLERYVYSLGNDITVLNGEPGIFTQQSDSTAVMNPVAAGLSKSSPARRNVEMPFPFLSVAPTTNSSVSDLLRSALVATVMGSDEVCRAARAERSISTLNFGPIPTCKYHEGAPHDGYLSEYLCHSRALAYGRERNVVRD